MRIPSLVSIVCLSASVHALGERVVYVNAGAASGANNGTSWADAYRGRLGLQAALTAESNRVVLPYDTSVRIPGWAKLDLGARWTQALDGTTVTWRAGVDNATNRKAWKESPYQFDHVYLYPLAARTWRVSAQVGF